MEEEIRLHKSTYDELQGRILTKNERIHALEAEIEKLKHDHEEEIDTLAKEGKVRVIEKPYSVMEMLMTRRKPKTEYKGFDDVKDEVYEHFKKGLFIEELERCKTNEYEKLIKQAVEREEKIDSLNAEMKKLVNRSLWARIMNKH